LKSKRGGRGFHRGSSLRGGSCGGGFDSGAVDGKLRHQRGQLVHREGEECRASHGEWKQMWGKRKTVAVTGGLYRRRDGGRKGGPSLRDAM
jgi:hypothetical protein